MLTLRNMKDSKNNLILWLKNLENRKKMIENKVRRKELMKIRTKINEIEKRRTIEKSWMKLRVGFLKRYKFENTLARLIKEKEGIQNRKIIDEKRYPKSTKNHKRLLWTTIWQQTSVTSINGNILKNIQPIHNVSEKKKKKTWIDWLIVRRVNQ